MTPQDHNKVIGIMHLIYGGFNALMMVIFVPFFFVIGAAGAADPNAPPALAAIFGFFGVLMLLLAAVFGLPPILAGYAMLKHKSWARVMAIIASVVEAISFPGMFYRKDIAEKALRPTSADANPPSVEA